MGKTKRNQKRRTWSILAAAGFLTALTIFPVCFGQFAADSKVKAEEETEEENKAPLPESGICGENATYTFDSMTGTLIIEGTGEIGVFNRFHDFSEREEIKNVVIGEGITELGSYLFQYDYNLESVSLPSTLQKIYTATFFECRNLKEITLPPNLERIDDYAFGDCEKIEEFVLPDELRMIGRCAFHDTGIQEIHIPAKVFEMDGALAGAHSLEKITVDPENQHFLVIDGVLYRKDSRTNDTLWLICYPSAFSSKKQVVLPSDVTKLCLDSVQLYEKCLVVPEGVKHMYYDSIGGVGFEDENYVIILGQGVKYETLSAFNSMICAYPDQIIHVAHDDTEIIPIYDADPVLAPKTGTVKLEIPEEYLFKYIRKAQWMSGNENIITVDSDGVVTAVGPGEADVFFVMNKKKCIRFHITSEISADSWNPGAASSGSAVPAAVVAFLGLSAAGTLIAVKKKYYY